MESGGFKSERGPQEGGVAGCRGGLQRPGTRLLGLCGRGCLPVGDYARPTGLGAGRDGVGCGDVLTEQSDGAVSRGRWAKKVGWVHRRLEGEGLTPGGGGVDGECGWQGKHLGGGVKAGSQIGWGWSWRAHDFWLGGVRSALKEGAPGSSRGSGMPETPTWRQLRAAVGPAPVLERPGWTGRPRETAPTSRRQGPRQMAIGSGGGTRAR